MIPRFSRMQKHRPAFAFYSRNIHGQARGSHYTLLVREEPEKGKPISSSRSFWFGPPLQKILKSSQAQLSCSLSGYPFT